MSFIHKIGNYYRHNQLLPEQDIIYMEYAITGILNELVKLLAYGIIFALLDQFPLYLFICLILIPLRWFAGGLHCKTFWGCFTTSFLWITILIYIPPQLNIPLWILQLFTLLGAIGAMRFIPYTPPFRPIRNPKLIQKLRISFLILVVTWLCLLVFQCFPTQYILCGTYTLLSQVCQLYIPQKRR